MLNYKASQSVNFYVIRDMVFNLEPEHIVNVHTENRIKRKMKLGGAV